MHDHFGDWYRVVSLDPRPDLLRKRWQAIDRVARRLTLPDALDLVRLSRGDTLDSIPYAPLFDKAVRRGDGTSAPMHNGLELRILASSALVGVMERGERDIAVAASLAMVCSRLGNPDPRHTLPDLTGYAEEYLAVEGERVRGTDIPTSVEVVVPDLLSELRGIEELGRWLAQAQQSGAAQPVLINQALGEGSARIANASASLADKINAVSAILTDYRSAMSDWGEESIIRREENALLWWCAGRYSHDLQQPLEELPLATACVVAAKELADRTVLSPGPIYARAALASVLPLDGTESVSIREALDDTRAVWPPSFGEHLDDAHITDLCPALATIARNTHGMGEAKWSNVGREVLPDARYRPLDLAHQLYREFNLYKLVLLALHRTVG